MPSTYSISLSPIQNTIDKTNVPLENKPYSPINFEFVECTLRNFADHIERNFEEITECLLSYESFEVINDETQRALDLLRNIHENKEYFQLRIGEITAFLPKNQPLYALCCFVIIPAFMASEVHFRIPHSMKKFFPKLLKILKINSFFPNIKPSTKERLEFLEERTAIRVDPLTRDSYPVSDVVIFTGNSSHAEILRLAFDKRTLFIANGSGHNPVVVTKTASIQNAVKAVTTLQFYNQGQDCAAPNSILVHKNIYEDFIAVLREEIKSTKIGPYQDRNARIGPISEPGDIPRIQSLLIENQKWLDWSTPGLINSKDGVVSPTIICKPLSEGANFFEVFAPIIFVQQYSCDNDLKNYFEDPQYARKAMYITVYGNSTYINNLINIRINGKILHDKNSILINRHLHERGVERGTQPYGGYGREASSICLNGKIISKPTLPQRDIHVHVATTLLVSKEKLNTKRRLISSKTELKKRNIRSLSKSKKVLAEECLRMQTSTFLVDRKLFISSKKRFVEISSNDIIILLKQKNWKKIMLLEPKRQANIQKIRKLLTGNASLTSDELKKELYNIPKELTATDEENKMNQLEFFKDIYQLLFNKETGPRLAEFLLEMDISDINLLLDA